jgi:hypothetical protein
MDEVDESELDLGEAGDEEKKIAVLLVVKVEEEQGLSIVGEQVSVVDRGPAQGTLLHDHQGECVRCASGHEQLWWCCRFHEWMEQPCRSCFDQLNQSTAWSKENPANDPDEMRTVFGQLLTATRSVHYESLHGLKSQQMLSVQFLGEGSIDDGRPCRECLPGSHVVDIAPVHSEYEPQERCLPES